MTCDPRGRQGIDRGSVLAPGAAMDIDRIHVCAPIRFINLRRNEVRSTISASVVRTAMKRNQSDLYPVHGR